MKNKLFAPLYIIIIITAIFVACVKDDKQAIVNRPVVTSKSWIEEFDDVSALSAKGWVILNNSRPIGQVGWRQGKYEVRFDSKSGQVVDGFPAYSANKSANDFVSVDFNAGALGAVASAWLITPAFSMKNGDVFTFYTKSHGDFADRMQVRANITTPSTDVGTEATTVGDFTNLWLDINPTMSATGYPKIWTQYTITIAGLPANAQINGRIAFRYYIPDTNADGDMVGVDKVEFKSN